MVDHDLYEQLAESIIAKGSRMITQIFKRLASPDKRVGLKSVYMDQIKLGRSALSHDPFLKKISISSAECE